MKGAFTRDGVLILADDQCLPYLKGRYVIVPYESFDNLFPEFGKEREKFTLFPLDRLPYGEKILVPKKPADDKFLCIMKGKTPFIFVQSKGGKKYVCRGLFNATDRNLLVEENLPIPPADESCTISANIAGILEEQMFPEGVSLVTGTVAILNNFWKDKSIILPSDLEIPEKLWDSFHILKNQPILNDSPLFHQLRPNEFYEIQEIDKRFKWVNWDYKKAFEFVIEQVMKSYFPSGETFYHILNGIAIKQKTVLDIGVLEKRLSHYGLYTYSKVLGNGIEREALFTPGGLLVRSNGDGPAALKCDLIVLPFSLATSAAGKGFERYQQYDLLNVKPLISEGNEKTYAYRTEKANCNGGYRMEFEGKVTVASPVGDHPNRYCLYNQIEQIGNKIISLEGFGAVDNGVKEQIAEDLHVILQYYDYNGPVKQDTGIVLIPRYFHLIDRGTGVIILPKETKVPSCLENFYIILRDQPFSTNIAAPGWCYLEEGERLADRKFCRGELFSNIQESFDAHLMVASKEEDMNEFYLTLERCQWNYNY